jgi:hypothetical protein
MRLLAPAATHARCEHDRSRVRRQCITVSLPAPAVPSRRHPGAVARAIAAIAMAPRCKHAGTSGRSDCTWCKHAGTSGRSDCTQVQACRHLGTERLHLVQARRHLGMERLHLGEAMRAPRDGALSPWCRPGSTGGSHPFRLPAFLLTQHVARNSTRGATRGSPLVAAAHRRPPRRLSRRCGHWVEIHRKAGTREDTTRASARPVHRDPFERRRAAASREPSRPRATHREVSP